VVALVQVVTQVVEQFPNLAVLAVAVVVKTTDRAVVEHRAKVIQVPLVQETQI
jgi:hypothetical protein